jgi:hypothetical protein
MKVRDLPDDYRKEAYACLRDAGVDPAEVENLPLEELALFAQAKIDDSDRRFAQTLHRIQLADELMALLAPVEAKHPGLPLCKAAWFLPQAQQQRVYAILRELNQLSRPVLVTRDRQPWHAAVERVIEIDHQLDFRRENGVHAFLVTSGENLDAMIDRTALRVLAQDSTWPPDRVRRYAEQILSTLGGVPR